MGNINKLKLTNYRSNFCPCSLVFPEFRNSRVVNLVYAQGRIPPGAVQFEASWFEMFGGRVVGRKAREHTCKICTSIARQRPSPTHFFLHDDAPLLPLCPRRRAPASTPLRGGAEGPGAPEPCELLVV